MKHKPSNKYIAFILTVSLILSLVIPFSIPLLAMEIDTDIYKSYKGCTAKFNGYFPVPISDNPENVNNPFNGNECIQLSDEETPDDFYMIIQDFYYDSKNGNLWYLVEASPGYTAPEKLISNPWVFQDIVTNPMGESIYIFPKEEAENTVSITDENGIELTSVTIPQYEKKELFAKTTLTVDVSYQWQIEYEPNKWCDIFGEDSYKIRISYGMVASRLNSSDSVNIRCRATSNSEVVYSESFPVSISRSIPTNSSLNITETDVSKIETVSCETFTANFESTKYYSANIPQLIDSTEATGNNTIYNIVIEYVFTNGRQAENSWIATIEAGGSYSGTVKSPTVVGYTPDQEEVFVDIQNISENKTYTVTYHPAEVKYHVVLQFQNIKDEDYYEFRRITRYGYTDNAVGSGLGLTAAEMESEGVYALPYDIEQKIAADGSTEVIIKYDRYYYLMTFDLGGGYNVEPIYARVGTPISVGIPLRAGYIFEGWTPTIPSTMPNHDYRFTAMWSPNPNGVKYFIAYWAENENDNNYSILKVDTHNGVPGSIINGSDTYGMLEGFHFDHADQNEIIKGDGSSVINVYYKRNTYTLIFAYNGGPQICGGTHTHNGCNVICGYTEHSHSSDCCDRNGLHLLHSCNTNDCKYGYEHEHGSSCYDCGKTAHSSHSVENGCYGMKFDGVKYGQDTSIYWSQAPLMKWLTSSNGTTFYTAAPSMPNGNLVIYGKTQSGSSTIHYYEYINNQTSTVQVKPDYVVGTDGWSFTDEDYIKIPGFTYHSSNKNNSGTQYYIYYKRNTYNLSFKNGNELIDKGNLLYQADISNVIDSDNRLKNPTYTGDDPEGFTFGGWYTTEQCIDGTEWIPTGATMPYNNLILYAKWVPIKHEVKLYITKADMEANKQYLSTMLVLHNTQIQESAISIPDNGEYKFVGWFYEEDGVEKGFDLDIPVRQNLNLYGKWYADELSTYTIKYAFKNSDDSLTYIAEDSTGSAIAGYEKTFNAKFGNELYEEYRIGYYPETSSHSFEILLGEENTYTFIYVEKESVQYTVKYLEKETGKVLHTERTDFTKEAIHTENFIYISGYRPDAYQKHLILSADDSENVIVFWYETDTTHTPVLVKHYLQNQDGETYNTSNPYSTTTDLTGVINSTYTVDIFINLEGFEFAKAEASHVVDGEKESVGITIGNTQVSSTVTNQGLLIELYYDRISYPYEFQFILQGTNEELSEPVQGASIFGSQVNQSAIEIPGFISQSNNQSMIIQIEDGETAVKNLRIFYYVEQTANIQYVVVGPQEAGTVTPTSQNNIPVLSGVIGGSTATPNAGYRFAGWYADELCATPVDSEWITGNTITPQKTKQYGDKEGYESATYYAKFEYNLTSLTIEKLGHKTIDENQTFIFNISGNGVDIDVTVHGNGSVTIDGLTVGAEYTVAEKTSWSWRYNASGWGFTTAAATNGEFESTGEGNPAEITLGISGNKLIFSNSRPKDQWLNGDSWCDNLFK